MKTIRDIMVKGKRILVRCDFNVPLDEKGRVSDDFRIKAALPTIQYLKDQEAKVVLMSHLDPDNQGVVSSQFTLEEVTKKLIAFGITVKKTEDCVGEEAKGKVNSLQDGEVLLLENLRFHKGETGNDQEFAKKLSELGDIYVNDAFSVCHRSHASVIGIPQYLPHYMGLLLEKEIKNLEEVLKDPKRPMIALVGGAKVTTKAKFIERILKIADAVIVSGLIKKELADEKIHFEKEEKIIAPRKDLDALDINESDVEIFKEEIQSARTVLWNGPFGKFEDERYKKGTLELARAIIKSGAFSVVGGGETVEFITKEGLLEKFSWVSTGGGAMLAYLSGEALPGLEALE